MIRYDTIRYDKTRHDTIRYDTIRYMIRYGTIFNVIGFPPGGSIRCTYTKLGKRQLYTKGKKCTKNKNTEYTK